MQPKAADRNVERRQRSQYATSLRRERHLFVRFAKRRPCVGFAGLDPRQAARPVRRGARGRNGPSTPGEGKRSSIGKQQQEPAA